MLRVRLLGLTLIAVMAFSGVASAHNFEASEAGAIKRVKNATQVFKTGSEGVAVECGTDAVSKGNAVKGVQLTVLADVSYSNCKVLGLFEATVTTAKYLFSADETVNVENSIVINVPAAGCHITVKPQNNLAKVGYKNSGSNVVVEPNVTGISSVGSGGTCGGASTTGTYTGTTEVEVAGATIAWK